MVRDSLDIGGGYHGGAGQKAHANLVRVGGKLIWVCLACDRREVDQHRRHTGVGVYGDSQLHPDVPTRYESFRPHVSRIIHG